MNEGIICEYVSKAYGVPACIGRIVEYRGKRGIISDDRGAYVGVTFDDEKANKVSNIHPLDEGLVYLGMGKVRKTTRSQERYKRYLDYGDCFDNFMQFVDWDMEKQRERRRF